MPPLSSVSFSPSILLPDYYGHIRASPRSEHSQQPSLPYYPVTSFEDNHKPRPVLVSKQILVPFLSLSSTHRRTFTYQSSKFSVIGPLLNVRQIISVKRPQVNPSACQGLLF